VLGGIQLFEGLVHFNWKVVTSARNRLTAFLPRFREWLAAGYAGLAAQVAFYFLLSIFPALLLVSSLLTYLPGCRSYFMNVQTIINSVLPESSADLINEFIESSHVCTESASGVISFGVVLLLFAGSNVFAVIARAMNHAYGAGEPRPFWKRRLLAIAFFLGAMAILALSLPIFLLGGRVGEAIAGVFNVSPVFLSAWQLALIPIASLAAGVGLTVLYLFGPGWKVRLTSAIWGAFIAVAGIIIISSAFQFFIRFFARYQRVYGTIAALIVLMIWMYLVSFVVLVGGLVVAVRQRRSPEPEST